MKKKRRWAVALIGALFCLTAGAPASAFTAEFNNPETLQKIALPPADTLQPMGTYLATGSCCIDEIGTGRVRISAYTDCYRKAETVVADVFLYQDSDDGPIYQTEAHFQASNTYMVEGWKDWSVARKHYYYAVGTHHVYGTGYHEANVSSTPTIYIG